jgi:hypothetical protein
MKNIFVLPTDKPSRLLQCLKVIELLDKKWLSPIGKVNRNIYITDDSEIKVGDWSYDSRGFVEKVDESYDLEVINALGKKIILTTDPQLIADGVQAIDDNFLEWFVKNPSCESVGFVVENYKEDEWVDDDFGGEIYTFEYERYKIIIPQEEPKQETLEEAVNAFKKTNVYTNEIKQKQERSYSEEDLRTAYFSGIKTTGEGWNGEYANGNNPSIEEEFQEGFQEWFEQYKKK